MRGALRYLAVTFSLAAGGLFLISKANENYAPEMYKPGYMATVADALSSGENYAVFDLNINIREMREEHIMRLPRNPGLIILGASQWQEAGADLIPGHDYYNAHVHRDYWEDMLGMVELLARHDKLPRDLVITVRDRLLTPVFQRRDFLWLPGIPYFQAMAKRLDLRQHGLLETYPMQRPRELLSLAMLFTNVTRWHNATDWPYPTKAESHKDLDLLLPDGSIRWSQTHQALFTQERSRQLSLAHADDSIRNPPVIDPRGVKALDTLLSYLALRGVRVHLGHPPFNPIYFDRVKGTPYMTALQQVEEVTRELAARHKLNIVGSFDPAVLGCTAEMFIDAEHSQAPCLRRLLADVANSVDLPAGPALAATADARTGRTVMATGWGPREAGRLVGSAVAGRGTNAAPSAAAGAIEAPSPLPIQKPQFGRSPAEARRPATAVVAPVRQPRQPKVQKPSQRKTAAAPARRVPATQPARPTSTPRAELIWPVQNPNKYQ